MQPAGIMLQPRPGGLAVRQQGLSWGDRVDFFPLKLNLGKISSIITGGRTSSLNARGENLELTIVFTASSSRLYNYLFVRPWMLEVVHLVRIVAASAGSVSTRSYDKKSTGSVK